jgi:CheY-like chemotaxis protein
LEKPPYTKCVLLIEDNEIDSIIARKLMNLTNFTWQLVWKDSGKTALEYLEHKERHPPDVVLLDLHMPVCNGWDFLEELSRQPHLLRPNCLLYVLTSSVSRYEVEEVLDNPRVKNVFAKPVTVDIIHRIISDILPLRNPQG